MIWPRWKWFLTIPKWDWQCSLSSSWNILSRVSQLLWKKSSSMRHPAPYQYSHGRGCVGARAGEAPASPSSHSLFPGHLTYGKTAGHPSLQAIPEMPTDSQNQESRCFVLVALWHLHSVGGIQLGLAHPGSWVRELPTWCGSGLLPQIFGQISDKQ